MAGITNNLYPPIIDTYMPAFVISANSDVDTSCRIYFSLSAFNNSGDIKNVQVAINNQKTNASVLNRTTHPSEIMLCPLLKEDGVKYYIDIFSSDLEDGFQINQYYKLQLRFTSQVAPDPPDQGKIDAWLAENLKHFSEWSTVSLIRGISQPHLDLLGFSEGSNLSLQNSTLSLVGTLSFEDPEEEETLQSYQARLFDNNYKLLSNSDIIYPSSYNNVNEINYTFNYMLEDGMTYHLEIVFTTKNLYTETNSFSCSVMQDGAARLPATIETEVDEEIGSVQINLIANTSIPFNGSIMFRRASSRTNFTVWEDILLIRKNNEPLNYSWYDYTVESGIWYKYCVQEYNEEKQIRGITTIVKEPVMVIFDDMFLCADKKQLRIKYNPQITSYKKNVSEAKVDTIGSQYPFIKRNGAMNYRQFSVSGMITTHTDYKDMFTSKEELYGSETIKNLYEEYNEKAKINSYNDYIYEREFREKVSNFLYADNVKLIRTTAEGNVLVKLMDINLNAEPILGRMIYSFSATAYEIDECTLANMDKYNISKGSIHLEDDLPKPPEEKIVKIGQIDGIFLKNVDIVKTQLTEKYTFSDAKGFITKVNHLAKIKLDFKMPPYLIHEDASHKLVPLGLSEPSDNTTVLGYIATINQTNIYINQEGIYELGVDIYSLSFPVKTDVTIDYTVVIDKIEDMTNKADVYYFYDKVGQIWGTFEYNESVLQRIWKKYYGKYKRYNQKLISVNGIRIEAEPNTVCLIKDSSSEKLKRFVINDSSSLTLRDDSSIIEGIYFCGYHLEPANEQDLKRDFLPDNKFIETGIIADSLDSIENPIINGVYQHYSYGASLEDLKPPVSDTAAADDGEDVTLVSDNTYALLINKFIENAYRYIFFRGRWHVLTENNDILCSVDGLVDYWCEIMKGVHIKNEI